MSASPIRAVIAPDAFKGSCSAVEAAHAMAEGARAALGSSAQIRTIPLADGGEGTLDALTAAWGGRIRLVTARDALGRDREARIGLSADGTTAIIEAAEANGLPHVADQPLRALDADSAGVGALVHAAVDAGARELLLCLGGSATSDGGAGMLRALGVALLDTDGAPIAPGARGLAALARVDTSGVLPAVREVRWRIAVDVDHPLTGPAGAAAVFSPQKGASPDEVARIDAGLARLAELLAHAEPAAGSGSGSGAGAGAGAGSAGFAAALAAQAGLGAAGGLALGPFALWGAELLPGAELVAEAAGLDAALQDADLVVTGEGRVDASSLSGKVLSRVLSGVARGAEDRAPDGATEPARPRVAVIAGEVALPAEDCRAAGFSAFSLAPGPATLPELRAAAPRLLAETAAQLCGLLVPPAGSAPRA